ncbi:methyl-accepting chemotaxis protein [Kineosporia sp. A_224]|uniref:methyl-accepting chemotaxis protein n=1 Tax=Kineosporia sp. A_224 TaxID=1962180 RepID=UPI000B4B3039|nr:methyl-accepting chemotaxis protein [Kineosporia sp. A_224]
MIGTLLGSARPTSAEHPLLGSASGLRAVLDAAPAPLFLMTDDGTIVYRNGAAVDTLQDALADVGEDGMAQLRTALARMVRTSRRYPAFEDIEAVSGGRRLVARCRLAQVPGGFLVTWTNITQQTEQDAQTHRLADEVTSAGDDLRTLGALLEESMGTATTQSGHLAQGSRELVESIREIASGAAKAADGAEQASAMTVAASQTVGQLVDSTSQIASIADIIRGIAEQTNLLALNATIEAARAGSAGSGFAVVANEVKELSRRTAEATERIRSLVDTVVAETTSTNEAMTQIVELIQDVAAQQASIAGAVEEQSAVAAAMGAGIDEVARVSSDAAGAAQTTLQTSRDLTDRASLLRAVVTG